MPELTLREFLERYPWRADETRGKKPLDYLWRFKLPVSPHDLWPFLIDTSTFNKMLGLPVMHYEEKNGRLYGQTNNAGFVMEWEEVPWEWDYLKGLNSARIYSRGFALYVRARYLLEATGAGTVLYVYFGWIPRHFAGALLLRLAMPRLQKQYALALQKIVQILEQKEGFHERQHALFEVVKHQKEKNNTVFLSSLVPRALDAGAPREILEKLCHYLLEAPEEELVRIRLKEVSRQLDVPLRPLIETALCAAHAGILTLSWDVVCPHCRGVRQSAKNLGDVPIEEHCEVCGITFTTEDISNLEVVFHINPEIRPVERKFFCAAEPATKRHILIQRHVAPQQTLEIATELAAGEYRVRIRGDKKYLPLSVGTGSEKKIALSTQATPIKAALAPVLCYANPTAQEQTLVVEEHEEDKFALRPAELFGMQLFRDLYSKEVLATGLKIELGRQNILFTDIVGSTRLYLERGDGEAFAAVRRHFQKIYAVVREHGGAVVKTIGDAAMVAFSDSLACLKAAVALQRAFRGNPETGNVFLRISIHAGPCIAVNLNSGIDYFGNTVNYAAKLQALVGAYEIAMSREFFSEERLRSYVAGLGLKVLTREFQAPGESKPSPVSVVVVA